MDKVILGQDVEIHTTKVDRYSVMQLVTIPGMMGTVTNLITQVGPGHRGGAKKYVVVDTKLNNKLDYYNDYADAQSKVDELNSSTL